MPASVDLQDLLQSFGDSIRDSVRVALPAVVKSYDETRQVAECQLVVREPVVGEDGATSFEELPIVPDVPVAWAGGGGFHAHFPLAPGDHVLLVFSDVATGVWRQAGKPSEPGDLRRHHLSYCFAIPCVRADGQAFADAPASGEAVIVAPSGGTVRVSKSGASSDFVALAAKVDANFEAITNMFSSWVVVPQDGGQALKLLTESLSFDPVGSVTLKAD